MIYELVRWVAWVAYNFRLLKRGAWGHQWAAVYWYAQIPGCKGHAKELADKKFGTIID